MVHTPSFQRQAVMTVPEQLASAEKMLRDAKGGDTSAVDLLRDLVASSARSAPPGDLIDIADYIVGFLRRHVREHVARN